MRAILIDNPGPQSRLLFQEQEIPPCAKDQLLLRVKATALNRADLMQRQGKYPPPPGESAIPGLEVAGEVVAVGTQVKKFKIGDRVYGLVGSGAYAEYCCVNQHLAELIPADWDFSHAAAIPEALITAHSTVFSLGKLKQDQTFLVHAAGSGISCFAIQMATLKGGKVFTTASNQDKVTKAEKLGSIKVVNYRTQDFAEVIGDQQLDLVLDYLGGNYFAKHLQLLKPKGRLIQIACMQGHRVDFDLAMLMRKRLQIIGFVLRAQSMKEKTALWQSAQKHWSSYLLNKQLTPVIDSEFKFSDLELAHSHMLSGAHFGKIVIRFD